MARPGRRGRRAKRWRRVVAAVALLGQFAATFGLPHPAFAASGKDVSKPYPCMNHSCGCRSADDCWAGCHCFTNAEKVAWADANCVDIPEFVRAAAVSETAARPVKCCKCSQRDNSTEPAEKSTPALDWVLGIAASRCHGHGPAALFQAAPAMTLAITPATHSTSLLIDTVPAFNQSPISLGTIPADPPPRV